MVQSSAEFERLGPAEGQQRDFWGYAETNRGTYCAEAAVHVNGGQRRRTAGEKRAVIRLERRACGVRALIGRGREHWAVIEPGHIVRDKARGAEAVIENFDLDLSAVRVPGEGQLDAQLRGTIERIGIVRHEKVGHVAAH